MRRVLGLEDGGDDGPSRVRGEVDEEAWREVAEADLPDEPAERMRALVTRVVQALGLRATVDVEETDEELRATVNGDDLGLLIGKHGATIDALQHLALRFALRGAEDRRRVVVDAAGYRERREAALHRSADRAVAEALQYGRAVELEPMRALERKIVHVYLRRPHRHRDPQRGRRARSPSRRLAGPARRHLLAP